MITELNKDQKTSKYTLFKMNSSAYALTKTPAAKLPLHVKAHTHRTIEMWMSSYDLSHRDALLLVILLKHRDGTRAIWDRLWITLLKTSRINRKYSSIEDPAAVTKLLFQSLGEPKLARLASLEKQTINHTERLPHRHQTNLESSRSS